MRRVRTPLLVPRCYRRRGRLPAAGGAITLLIAIVVIKRTALEALGTRGRGEAPAAGAIPAGLLGTGAGQGRVPSVTGGGDSSLSHWGGTFPCPSGMGQYPVPWGWGHFPLSHVMGTFPCPTAMGTFPCHTGLGTFPCHTGTGDIPLFHGVGDIPLSHRIGGISLSHWDEDISLSHVVGTIPCPMGW